MIYVTHDQLEAMTMSTRIAVMNAGVLQQFATPADIFHHPANVFVAGFIGSPAMSLVDAELTDPGSDGGGDGEGRFRVRCGALDVVLAPGLLRESAAPGPVSLGIRPEDILLGSGDHSAAVRVVERTGHESIVRLDADGTSLIARAPGDTPIEAGETVRFSLRAERLHLFDGVTGQRLNAENR